MSEKPIDVLPIEGTRGVTVLATAVDSISDLGELVHQVTRRGIWSVLHLPEAVALLPRVFAVVADAGNAIAELKDLSAGERQYLLARFRARFDLEEDMLEAFVEGAAEAINKVADAYEAARAFYAKWRAKA